MPEALSQFYEKNTGVLYNPAEDGIPMSCQGKTSIETELMGPVAIFPRTFSSVYYPYENSKGYISPIIMIQFLDLPPAVLLTIRCKIWTASIADDEEREAAGFGTVAFELLVEDDIAV